MITIVRVGPTLASDLGQGDDGQAFCFAADAWQKSYRDAALGGEDGMPPLDLAHALVRGMPIGAYHASMRRVVQAELEQGFCIATPDGDPGTFLGFSVVRDGVLVYVYVKRRLRRSGVGSMLISGAEHYCIKTWPWVDYWLARHGIEYDPGGIHRDD